MSAPTPSTGHRPRVAVIGGGIAGIAAALRLRDEPVDVHLFEQEPYLGGKIRTEHVDGHVIEAGPDAFISWKPRGKALCDQLGVETIGSNEDARRAFVARAGVLHPLPDGIAGIIPRRFVPTLRSPLLSPLGKARLSLEWAIPRRRSTDEESLADFVQRRLGREVWERIVEPLVTGIYAGDGTHLAVEATFPLLRDAENTHGSLIRAGLAARRAGRTPPAGPMFLTTSRGLGGIVEAAEKALDGHVTVHTATPIDRCEPADGGWRVRHSGSEVLDVDGLILATPPSASASLVRTWDPALADIFGEVRTASVATVTVAYRESDVTRPIHGHGYVNPRAEDSPIVACSITSTKFPVRAREGSVLIRAHVGRVGGANPADWEDLELVGLVHRELTATLGVAGPPTLHRVFRWPDAIPQYDIGHRDRVAAVRRRVGAWPALAVAGAMVRGVGIPDCISSGDEAAEAILAAVAPTSP